MKEYKISDIQKKRILGRTAPLSQDKPLVLFWAASALEVRVRSSEVAVRLSADYDTSEPWVSVFVNGFFVSRFMVEKGEPRLYTVCRGLNPQNENLITIYKDTQPMTGEAHHSLFVHGVALCDDGVFCDVPPRKMRLEFVGDSITSGEGLAGSADEMDWIPQWFVASESYAAQVARNLDADFSCLSQCGWGLCWGWDGNRNNRIPPFYEQVCGVAWGEYQEALGAHAKFDFNGGCDFVVINLGTNDNSAFFQPPWREAELKDEYRLRLSADGSVCADDARVFINSAKDFLKVVRRNNPNAVIIWCWGMIPLDVIPPLIQTAVEDYMGETGDKRVCALELDSMDEVEKLADDKGSRGHPGPKTHRLAAQKICDLIRKLS